MYSEISVKVSEDVLEFFLATVVDLVPSIWRRDFAAEVDIDQLMMNMDVRYAYFARIKGPKALVGFLFDGSELKMINLLVDGKPVSHAEHSRIAKDLWTKAMERACKELGLEGKFTASRNVKPEDGLPSGAVQALHGFAHGVNKSGSICDPDDIQRWCLVMAVIHATGSELSEDRLNSFLKEHKFPEEVIGELLLQYEVGIALLRLYDRVLEVKNEPAVH